MTDIGLWAIAANDPERTAVIDPGGTVVSYAELAALADRYARGLQEPRPQGLGLRPGDCVAGMLPNSTEALALFFAALDLKVILQGGVSGVSRIVRHLWRMCLGLTMAAGSAFTNGLPRLLPGPMHVTPIFFLPQFMPVALLIFWMIRVRFTGWFKRDPLAHTAWDDATSPAGT